MQFATRAIGANPTRKTAVPHSEPPSLHLPAGGEVLTLSETAAFLRVPEEAVLELVSQEALSGRQVGGEWRFLKHAVIAWLLFGPDFPREFRLLAPLWMLDHKLRDDLLRSLEHRISGRLPVEERQAAPPGTKQAVLRHFGVFRDDADVEDQLAGMRARREAAGE